MEDPKNTKDDKKEKESPELKEELTEEEVKGVDAGNQPQLLTPPFMVTDDCNGLKTKTS